MSMEFGLFIGGWVPDYLDGRNDAYEHERLIDETRIAEAGDRSNWKYVWVTEHHFLAEYSHISANEIVMPHILARTERIRVASGIINITPPVNHPARIAERVAMLDHLSGGRFDFGTGRGSSTTEQGGFGITDPELTKEMFDEVMPEFRKMWSQDSYSLRRPLLLDARAQRAAEAVREAPPADVGGGRQPRHVREGRRARPRRPLLHRRLAGEDGAARRDLQGGDRPTPSRSATTSTTTSPSPPASSAWRTATRARQLMTESRNGRQQSLVFRYLDTFPKPPGIPEWPTEIPDPTLEQLDVGVEKGTSIVGTPDDCAEALAEVGRHRRRPADHGPDRQRLALRGRRGVRRAVRQQGHPAVRRLARRGPRRALPPRGGRADGPGLSALTTRR